MVNGRARKRRDTDSVRANSFLLPPFVDHLHIVDRLRLRTAHTADLYCQYGLIRRLHLLCSDVEPVLLDVLSPT